MTTLECVDCRMSAPSTASTWSCPNCGSGLLLVEARANTPLLDATPRTIWDFSSTLPDVPEADRVSLGEGGTPLIELSADRWIKWEGVGPTQSYKDRFNAVNISVARSLGVRGVALISTGNAGLAASAYGAAAGLRVRVVSTPAIPPVIARGIEDFGAELLIAPRTKVRELHDRAMSDGYAPGSRSFPAIGVTPYGAEGYKTIAYEITASLGQAPDAVVTPVGGGDGIYGIHRGFVELHDAGLTRRIPRMIAARTTSPIAPSIADDEMGPHARAAVESSRGKVIEVDGDGIRRAVDRLARAGVSSEPASAASLAAAEGLDDPVVVAVVTGSGFRWGTA